MSRPRPVITTASIAGVITSLAGVLTFLGYNEQAHQLSDGSAAITSVVIAAVALGSHVLPALHVQSKVTPVASPVAHDGTPLVPVDTIATVDTYVPEHAAVIDASEPEPIDASDDETSA